MQQYMRMGTRTVLPLLVACIQVVGSMSLPALVIALSA